MCQYMTEMNLFTVVMLMVEVILIPLRFLLKMLG
ncbi:hypothetical protein Goshw_024876, partial [Gossypium schwendimanii]|nr:hypothetical protein [Gossypium schwendimanii]